MTSLNNVVLKDFAKGLLHWPLWGRLGWQDIRRRYRRTMIGPFWTSLSLGIFILALGFVWANLWGKDPQVYLPYLCSGMLVWVLMQAIINEGCTTFIAAEGLVKQLRFPYSMLAVVVVWRNLIVFFHNLLIFLLVALYAGVPITWNSLLIVPALLLFFINGIWVTTILGILCSRFRDFQQVISSILSISIFVTPILWKPDQLGQKFSSIVNYNILFHYVDILRSSLLGQAPSSLSWGVVILGTFLGWWLMIILYSRFRGRLAYWL